MALIECPECKKPVLHWMSNCPKCGAPIVPGRSRAGGPRKRHAWKLIFVLLVLILGIGYWVWRARTNDEAAPVSAGLIAAFREPQRVVNERAELKSGEFVAYPFSLRTDARVHLLVTASPGSVDVMLMAKEEAQRQTRESLLQGRFTSRQELSSKQVHAMDRTEILPKGEWTFVLTRPPEGVIETSASVIVTVY